MRKFSAGEKVVFFDCDGEAQVGIFNEKSIFVGTIKNCTPLLIDDIPSLVLDKRIAIKQIQNLFKLSREELIAIILKEYNGVDLEEDGPFVLTKEWQISEINDRGFVVCDYYGFNNQLVSWKDALQEDLAVIANGRR